MNFNLSKSIAERDEMLRKYPHLRKKQAEIDEIMAKTPEKDRVEVLFIMLGTKLTELNKELAKLKGAKYE